MNYLFLIRFIDVTMKFKVSYLLKPVLLGGVSHFFLLSHVYFMHLKKVAYKQQNW